MKTIYRYNDYRRFLKDYYHEQKQTHPERFSFRYFSKRAGFQTSNFLQLVMKGKRNLGIESIVKIAKALGLKGQQYHYFENLVLFNQSSNADQKSHYFEKLVSFRGYRAARLMDGNQMMYFSKWYYPVVREMVNLHGFRPDPKWIASHISPKISEKEAADALDVLRQLGLVHVTQDGRWRLADPHIKTEDQCAGHELASFHRHMINLGVASLEKPHSERNVSGMTVSVSKGQFDAIQKKIQEFQEGVRQCLQLPSGGHEDSDGSKISMVCQLNVQFFPLTNKGGQDV